MRTAGPGPSRDALSHTLMRPWSRALSLRKKGSTRLPSDVRRTPDPPFCRKKMLPVPERPRRQHARGSVLQHDWTATSATKASTSCISPSSADFNVVVRPLRATGRGRSIVLKRVWPMRRWDELQRSPRRPGDMRIVTILSRTARRSDDGTAGSSSNAVGLVVDREAIAVTIGGLG